VLWLLRHGDAADGSPDAERPLPKKGEKQSRAAGRALAALGGKIDACLTSPKVRAAETARLACEELGVEPRLEPKLAGGPFDAEALAAYGADVVLPDLLAFPDWLKSFAAVP
jgi:phosphohistidine phosphatase SixA